VDAHIIQLSICLQFSDQHEYVTKMLWGTYATAGSMDFSEEAAYAEGEAVTARADTCKGAVLLVVDCCYASANDLTHINIMHPH
jgi:hypothetical protein